MSLRVSAIWCLSAMLKNFMRWEFFVEKQGTMQGGL